GRSRRQPNRQQSHLTWTEGTASLQAHRRLNQIMRRLDAAEIGATGSVPEDLNPVDAAKNALRPQPYDEIIIATPPAGISRWIQYWAGLASKSDVLIRESRST